MKRDPGPNPLSSANRKEPRTMFNCTLRKIAASLPIAALLAGCAQLPANYKSTENVGGDVVAFKCVNEEGQGAGKAYFDRKNGLAMMMLEMGLDLTGRALLLGPMLIGEVFLGSARVEFKIPDGGGPSEVTMYPAPSGDPEDGPVKPQKKLGHCDPIRPDASEGEKMNLGKPPSGEEGGNNIG